MITLLQPEGYKISATPLPSLKDDTFFYEALWLRPEDISLTNFFFSCSTICILPHSLPVFKMLLIALSLSQIKFGDIGSLSADRQIISFPIIAALGQVVLRIL